MNIKIEDYFKNEYKKTNESLIILKIESKKQSMNTKCLAVKSVDEFINIK